MSQLSYNELYCRVIQWKQVVAVIIIIIFFYLSPSLLPVMRVIYPSVQKRGENLAPLPCPSGRAKTIYTPRGFASVSRGSW